MFARLAQVLFGAKAPHQYPTLHTVIIKGKPVQLKRYWQNGTLYKTVATYV